MSTHNITILGTGAYGSCLANVLADNGHQVVMYGIDEQQVDDLVINHKNRTFFGELKLNEKIKATTNLAAALDKTEILILGVPVAALKTVIEQVVKTTKKELIVINTAKGLDGAHLGLLSDYICQEFSQSGILKEYAAIYGPSIASEVARRLPTGVTMVSRNLELANKLASLFANEYFFVETSTDLAGCEIAAALKNAIAIGAGIFEGLGVGDNARASLITTGIQEIYQIAQNYGAQIETFFQFAGLGDLVLTATSLKSRNYRFGKQIALDDNPKKTLQENKATVEGVKAVEIAHLLCQKYKIKAQVLENLYEILYNFKRPIILVNNFLK